MELWTLPGAAEHGQQVAGGIDGDGSGEDRVTCSAKIKWRMDASCGEEAFSVGLDCRSLVGFSYQLAGRV